MCGIDYGVLGTNGSTRSSETEMHTVNGGHAWDNLGGVPVCLVSV